MKKLHLCCGDIFLSGYENCDHDGKLLHECTSDELNVSLTDLGHYFKYPFEYDVTKRVRRPFIIDTKMDILKKWPWEDSSVDEIVSVSAFEHFEHLTELPHIIDEAYRVLKPGGVWKFDFPDIKAVVEKYHDTDPQFMSELIYCNRKNKYSVHCWSYTPKSIPIYLVPDKWSLEFRNIVTHCYPMTGVWATKI